MKPERIGGDVKRELGRFGAVGTMAELVEAWPELVGEQIARNAWPARIAREGTLHVATSSSAWAFELQQLAPQLLERFRDRFGKESPTGLRFAPGKLPEAPERRGERIANTPIEPAPEHVELAAALTEPIEDENLREVVAKTAARSLARAPDDRSV